MTSEYNRILQARDVVALDRGSDENTPTATSSG